MGIQLPEKRSPRRNGEKSRNPRPAGNETPIIPVAKALAIAHAERADMAHCQLSDEAVTLITLRVNSAEPIASIARKLGMSPSAAYNIIASPTGQELVARLARAVLGTAATTATRTLEQLCTHKDPQVALAAAQDIMERAGLGHSQRAAPSTTNAFAFSFGATRKDEA
jgi:hypothetical protein